MDPELPRYARPSPRGPTGAAHSTTPRSRAGTASRRPPTEHQYHLTNSKGAPWLTLKVISNSPASHYLPSYFEGETVRGNVVLTLEKEDSIKSITVQIVGQMTSSVTEVLNFVQVSDTLWRPPDTPSSQSSGESSGRLVGSHTWPFSLVLPRQCQIKSAGGILESHPLPGSFSERLARVHIQYMVLVTVHRRRFRVDSSLSTVVGYNPIIRPGEASVRRQIAYLENTPIPGPDTDPDGWKWLAPLSIRGSVFSTRTVDATCTLALALPLCYTRGSAIPCALAIETADPQALDLLSAPRAPVVRLLRRVASGEATLASGSGGGKNMPSMEYEHVSQEIATAVWWPAETGEGAGMQAGGTRGRGGRRVLLGEIHLSSNLKPSSRLGRFELSYTVAVFSPRAVAFQPEGTGDVILQQEPIVVGTVHAPGPRPRVYSPPGYDDYKCVLDVSLSPRRVARISD